MIKDYVIFDEFINYSGPFELKEFYDLTDKFFKNKHYNKKELKHYEINTEEGRRIEMVTVPNKQVSEYIQYNVEMLIIIDKIQDINIEVKGKKRTIQQGDINIRFRVYLAKLAPQHWTEKPWLFFVKNMLDKFIYKTNIGDFQGELKTDVKQYQDRVKSFLNMYTRK